VFIGQNEATFHAICVLMEESLSAEAIENEVGLQKMS